ncbi:hypothetical protein, partial [Verminephrobacter aporrectodeae]|uniref:hypothetical protein n=1 Tax=Verminephrobacter aporrectodeae TaxID=1110389 RepID=UPI0022431889
GPGRASAGRAVMSQRKRPVQTSTRWVRPGLGSKLAQAPATPLCAQTSARYAVHSMHEIKFFTPLCAKISARYTVRDLCNNARQGKTML